MPVRKKRSPRPRGPRNRPPVGLTREAKKVREGYTHQRLFSPERMTARDLRGRFVEPGTSSEGKMRQAVRASSRATKKRKK